MARDPSVHDYYRLFEAPGLDHCFGGSGLFPPAVFDTMVEWVEKKIAPDTLDAVSLGTPKDQRKHRILCPYPAKARYKGTGDGWARESFYCG